MSDCLQSAGVDTATADRLQQRRLRDLYRARVLPVPLTLGAVIALDAVQRCEWLGLSDDEALSRAIETSSRLPALIADRVWQRIDLPINIRRTP